MSKSICYTCAYNAEDTIGRAVDSVLGQTCPDLKYYICDNGSKDRTRQIILGYAKNDSRVVPVLREFNHLDPKSGGGNPLVEFVNTTLIDEFMRNKAEYFFNLDADDEYKPEFLAKMVAFIEENDLDAAACGNDVIEKGVELPDAQKTGNHTILEGEAFGRYYPDYHTYMRSVWGKLYRIALLEKCDYANFKPLYDVKKGADTVFCTKAFMHAKRAGVLYENLHKYYVAEKGVSRSFNSNRIASIRIVYDIQTAFLKEKAGSVSDFNKDFLFKVYYNDVAQTASHILKSELDWEGKLDLLHDLFSCPQTREMSAYSFISPDGGYRDYNQTRNTIYRAVSGWIFTEIKVRTEECLEMASDILSSTGNIYVPYNNWSDDELLSLYTKTYQKSESDAFRSRLETLMLDITGDAIV